MIEESEIQKFKSYLPQYLTAYCGINNLKNNFHCLNPNHPDNNPSMSYSPRHNKCKCFSCNVWYDIYDLIEIQFGITNFREKHNKLAEIFNELDKIVPITTVKEVDYIEKDFTKYFNNCLKKTTQCHYLAGRGIKDNLLVKYRIGYDDKRQLVVFPLNDHSYFARSTTSNGKYKSKGTSYLFNENLIKYSDNNSIIYVTESIIDSLSLESVIPEIQTVSLNGTTNTSRLLSLCKDYDYKGCFILALDNDSAGRKAQQELKDELDKLNIPSFCNDLISTIDDGKYKDINKVFCSEDKERFVKTLHYFYEQYQYICYQTMLKRSDAFEYNK